MNSADHDKWELNRMLIGGAVKMGDSEAGVMNASLRDGIEIEEDRVMLLVHDIKPPFLDGSATFTKQTKPVQVVRDPTSDFAVLAKKGSAVLRFVRERADRQAMREKFWDLSGTKMGSVMAHDKKVSAQAVQQSSGNGPKAMAGIEESKDPALTSEKPTATTENVDYKTENRYANSITKK